LDQTIGKHYLEHLPDKRMKVLNQAIRRVLLASLSVLQILEIPSGDEVDQRRTQWCL
jgi:hypothetical protein